MLCDNLEGWDVVGGEREVLEGGDICILMNGLCCCMAETSTIIPQTKIKKKRKKRKKKKKKQENIHNEGKIN